jgi:carbon-monoxide dehydrogenase medium subunit
MAYWQEYVQPRTVDAALEALREAPGEARLIAGGTDFLLDLQQGRHPPLRRLVDITSIGEMRRLDIDGDIARIGAAVPHRQIVEHPILAERAACLTRACSLIGGPQVRNVATLGGNVAHALPAGDGTIALLALDAEAEIATLDGRRWVAMEDLFTGPGTTSFDRSAEVLVAFRFRLAGAGEASAFERIMRPQGVAIAILNLACWLRVDDAGTVTSARVALGPGGPTPFRATRTESLLTGHRVDEGILAGLAESLLQEASLRSSAHRATHEYRQHLVPTLLKRTLLPAYDAAVRAQHGPAQA